MSYEANFGNNPDPVEIIPEKMDADEGHEQEQMRLGLVAALRELGFNFPDIKVPEIVPGTEILQGKKLVMVDDDNMLIATSLPALTAATQGTARALWHKKDPEHTDEQAIGELADKLLASEPDLVLLDFHLAGGIEGHLLAREIRKRGYDKPIIGTSSMPDGHEETLFEKEGIPNLFNKQPKKSGDIGEEVLAVAHAYEDMVSERRG